MGIATGFTADHMDAIQAACIVSAATPSDELILTRFDGGTIDAGNIKGPQGIKGVLGNTGPAGPGSSTDAQIAALINAVSASQTSVDSRKMRVATDWNNEKKSGLITGSTSALSTPSPGLDPWVGRVYAQPGSGMVAQIAWRQSVIQSTPEMWARLWTGTIWTQWNRIFYDTGWISLPLASTAITPGLTGIVEYRVLHTQVYVRTRTACSFNSVAIGSTINLCMANAIPVAFQPEIIHYGLSFSSSITGWMGIGADGSITLHPCTGAMTSATIAISYPYPRAY